jgi:hypothetical protein
MILRKNEIKHYSGLESDLISTLPSGDTFFSTDTNKLYKYNEDELPYLINSSVGGVAYTSLVQLLNQTATNAPVATEVYNNTGETFTWSYVSQGVYRITGTNTPFTLNKTVVFTNLGSHDTTTLRDIGWNRISDSIIEIETATLNDTITNGSFEVKIYS